VTLVAASSRGRRSERGSKVRIRFPPVDPTILPVVLRSPPAVGMIRRA
jgi:hypothetical protein